MHLRVFICNFFVYFLSLRKSKIFDFIQSDELIIPKHWFPDWKILKLFIENLFDYKHGKFCSHGIEEKKKPLTFAQDHWTLLVIVRLDFSFIQRIYFSILFETSERFQKIKVLFSLVTRFDSISVAVHLCGLGHSI